MKDGSLGGYATEVIDELFKLTDYRPDIHILPWARAYEISKKEANILIFSIAHTQDRDQLFHWVGNLKYERFYFWGLKSQFMQKKPTFKSLKDMVIASANDYNTEQYLIDQGFKKTFPVVKSSQSLLMLDKKRVDIILSNEMVLRSLSETINYDFLKLKKLQEAVGLQNNLSIAFSLATDPKIIERFQAAYRQLVASGKLAEIKNKWAISDENE